MKRSKAKSFWKSLGKSILNLIFILIDLIICVVVLYSAAITILFFLGTIALSYGIWDNVVCVLKTYFIDSKTNMMAELIADIGTYASIAIVPIVSFFISSHIANNQNDRRICEALAKTKNIDFYVAILPMGIWYGLEESYSGHCIRERDAEFRSLLDYDFCFNLVFEGEFFQSYKIDIMHIGYDTYFDLKGAKLKRPEPTYIQPNMTFVSDTTGAFCGSFVEGTSLIALMDGGDYRPIEYYLNKSKENVSKNIFYELHIEQRDETGRNFFSQMFRKNYNQNLRFFPIIRFFYQISQKHHKNITSYRLELYLDSLATALTQNKSRFQLAIYDLEIKTIRKAGKKGKKREKKGKNRKNMPDKPFA